MKAFLPLIAILSTIGDSPVDSGVAAPRGIPWNAIVILRCERAVGSAFHIGNGRYVTAEHVLRGGGGGCAIAGEPVRVLHRDEPTDSAEITGPVLADRFETDCSGFRPNRHYLATGYAGGVSLFRLPLIYSAFGKDPDNGNGQFVGPEIIPGMSGGPLITEDYRVSGIVVQRWPARARSLADTFFCKGRD